MNPTRLFVLGALAKRGPMYGHQLRREARLDLRARTVYAITGEGRRELHTLRAEALQEVALHPDPVDLALAMSTDLDERTLGGFVDDRMLVLSAQVAQFSHHGDRVRPDQAVADDLVGEHARLRVEAELTWHRLVLDRLGDLAADSEHRAGP